MVAIYPPEFYRGAKFSPDRRFRYSLWRMFNESLNESRPPIMVIGLNPSTANETDNDNTISKVVKVAKNHGFGGVYMMNLFPIVSTDPKVLSSGVDTMGDFSDAQYVSISEKCEGRVVFAWGNFPEARERAVKLIEMFPEALCFKQNKNGSPKHPLYCPDNSVLIPFNPKLIKP